MENTIFHLVGKEDDLLENVSEISFNFFKDIIKEGDSISKLKLLRTLLQVMGWGITKIIAEEDKIIVEIKNPPYGLQKEEDNWNFLANVILGYLWLLNVDLNITNIETSYKFLRIVYM